MPKSSKKKKEKNVDFTKAKLKLGKGKKSANNATDTSFKARSIAVPHQTIGQEKDASKPTTRRNLNLDDLLVHLKHYNPTTRKDAIWGLRELLDNHPLLMETSLAPVIQACARIVGDEDAEVRKTLITFLEWFLRLAPINKIRPHVPVLVLFITSAQTHIFPSIRIDAIRFIDLLLELTPEIITEGWSDPQSTGSRVLEGYLGLLNAGSSAWTGHKDDAPAPSTSSVTLSSNSRYIVLASLSSFIRRAVSSPLSQSEIASSFWYMASSFPTHAEFLSFFSLIRPRLSTVLDDSVCEIVWSKRQSDTEDFVGTFDYALNSRVGKEFSLSELGEVGQGVEMLRKEVSMASQSSSATSRIARLAHTLHPILVSTWLDVAPSVFSADKSRDKLNSQLATCVMQLAGSLYGTIFRDVDLAANVRSLAFDDLTALLGYMSTYLPCTSDSGDTQSEESSRNLSFAYCELTSLAMVASQNSSGTSVPRTNSSSKLKQTNALSIQVDRVGEYVVKALDGELRSVSLPLGYSLAASAYTMLLPTIWSLLKHHTAVEGTTLSSRIRSACINHALRTPSKSSTKGVATQFIGLLVLLHTQREYSLKPNMGLTADEFEQFRKWLRQLPKVLCEVGMGDPVLTETILRLLLRIAQRRPALFDAATSGYIRSGLIPYFATMHPEKGMVFGPFAKLKQWPRLRRLSLDVAVVHIQDAATADPLRTAVKNAVRDTEDAQYWCTLVGSS